MMGRDYLSLLELDLVARQEELRRLQQDVEALSHVIRMYKASLGERDTPSTVGGATSPFSNSVDTANSLERGGHSRRNSSELSKVFRDAAYRYLEGRTEPTPTRELFDALVSQEVEIPGENPAGNLSAHLSRDPRFTSFGRHGWQLAKDVSTREELIESIAKDTALQLDSGLAEQVRNVLQLNPGGSLPPEADALLLAAGRDRLGRHFTEDEKRFARRSFRQLVSA